MKLSLASKIVLVLLIVGLIILPQIFLPHADFRGTDDAAEEAITSTEENYVPWFENIFDPGEWEENLFIFQQVLGVGGLILCFGYLERKSKKKAKKNLKN
ncbi:MAG: energy-coupling factor ABC transporter substrate-binding protein [Eubacteriaceae bacterium]